MLCLASISMVTRHHILALDAQCASFDPDAADIDGLDEFALLQEVVAPHVATQTTVTRRQGGNEQASSDVALTQAANQVNISGSSLRSWGAEGSSLRGFAGSSLQAWGAEVPTAKILHGAASLLAEAKTKTAKSLEEIASAVADAVSDTVAEDSFRAPGATAFTTHLLAGVAAEAPAESVKPEYAPVARMHEGFWEYVSSLIASTSTWVSSHPTLLTIVPVTLAFLAFAAACMMIILSTLKSWGGLFYCVSGSSPVAEGLNNLRSERPGPLQPLRVLQMNLSSAGRGQGNGQP